MQGKYRLFSTFVSVSAIVAWSPSVLAHDPDAAAKPHAHHSGTTDGKFTFGEPGTPSKVDRVVKITMRDLSFEPNELDMTAGETIRFVVTNAGAVDHDFTLGDAATQIAHRKEMAEAMETSGGMHHHHDANAITVKAGEVRELIWKFTEPGRLEFDCNVPGHYEAGMGGVILVRGKDST